MDPLSFPEARRAVLYVEDHPVNAMLMAALFEHRPDLHLVVAENGQQALCIAPRLQPALLLLDLNLPDCHGSVLLPLVRQLPSCEDTPAVAVTADATFDITGTGFAELWPKPLHAARLLARLDHYVPASSSRLALPVPPALRPPPLGHVGGHDPLTPDHRSLRQ